MTKDASYYTANEDPGVLRIFVIRHGQTAENSKKILQGHLDTDLNETGIEQAHKLGSYLANDKKIKFDKIYTSDLKRCQQTLAQILDSYPKQDTPEVVKDSGLRERSMGEIQGMHLDQAEEYAAKHGKGSFRDFGEKPDAFGKRLTTAVNNIVEDCRDLKNIAMVSHGGSIRQLLMWLDYQEHDIRRIVVFNTSVTVIDYVKDAKRYGVKKVGMTQHLGSGEFVVSDLRLR
ncbi:hypothetical protein ACU8KH_02279 [Lachancea thermotolerans]